MKRILATSLLFLLAAAPLRAQAPRPAESAVEVVARSLADNLDDIVETAIVFATPVLIVAAVFYFLHRRNKLVHETLRAMVDKGLPITPELVVQLGSRHSAGSSRTRHLLPGLVLSGVGIALLITQPVRYSGSGGCILLFVGAAFLIVWRVERKQNGPVPGKPEATTPALPLTPRKPDGDAPASP